MSVLKTEGYRSLPNSKWLQKLLKHQIDIEHEEIKLEILTSILERCKKIGIGKPISLTKTQWDGIHKIMEVGSPSYGYYFKTEDWNERTKFFDIDPFWKNIHSKNKYIDLFHQSSAPSSQEQWMQCVEGVCDCSEEDIMYMDSLEPSIVTPPTISEEEWEECAEVGFIGYDKDDLCSVCNKSITEFDHVDHKPWPNMHCFGCNKDLPPHRMVFPISLTKNQRQCMGLALRYLINEYEEYEEQVDERSKTRYALELKLMKNARHKLRSSVSGQILVDPYTISVLLYLCDQFIKAEEKIPEAHIEEFGKIVDVLSGIREMLDNLPQILSQTGRPLCCECAIRDC